MLRVEPLPRGTGFEFVDEVKGGTIPGVFMASVEKGVRQALDGVLGPAVRAQIAGGVDLPDLRRRPERPRVLVVASRDDATVRAADLAALGDLPGVTVTWVQDVAPGRRVSHVDLAADAVVADLVRAELARRA